MRKFSESKASAFFHVAEDGLVTELGPQIPSDLDSLGAGKIVGFSEDIGTGDRRRWVADARAGGWLRTRRFRRAGVELYDVRSRDYRAMVASMHHSGWRGAISQAAVFGMLYLAIMVSFEYTQSFYNTKKGLVIDDSRSSYLKYVLDTKLDKEPDIDLEAARADKAAFEQWKKERTTHEK